MPAKRKAPGSATAGNTAPSKGARTAVSGTGSTARSGGKQEEPAVQKDVVMRADASGMDIDTALGFYYSASPAQLPTVFHPCSAARECVVAGSVRRSPR